MKPLSVITKWFVAMAMFVYLTCGVAIAADINFKLLDDTNDPSDVAQYEIYWKIGENAYDTDPVATVMPSNMAFTLNMPDGDCYTLYAITVDPQGMTSPRSSELVICIDAAGNPTFPNGPSPVMIVIPR